ncbi:MAG: hypothetical protein AAGF26_15460 [Cyanobacteria bacterium P01_G01_bin.49]
MMVTYGLRNHDVFKCHFDPFPFLYVQERTYWRYLKGLSQNRIYSEIYSRRRIEQRRSPNPKLLHLGSRL